MFLKRFICMFATGVFVILMSATASLACSRDHSSGTESHVDRISHSLVAATVPMSPSTKQKQVAVKDHSKVTVKAPIKATVTLTAVQGDEDYEGGCIHANGCTCTGRRSHTNTCGTQGDCHAHSGLTCTWGGVLSE